MTPESTTLSRRWRACPDFRWMAGMLDDKGRRIECIIDVDEPFSLPAGPYFADIDGIDSGLERIDDDALPNLEDAATVGVLPGMVREALGCPTAWAWFSTVEGWIVTTGDGDRIGTGPTESKAWITALENKR